ncbi:MAG: hypothetical protein DI585_05430 [Pseudomonas fluorescens]|nr:MAG: hypothetical protein DI585_05430 [Pseudomonas fluorescens]
MTWLTVFPENTPLAQGCVVAIGNFDGVHQGHLHVLALAKSEAEARHVPLVVLTFEPHPRSVLRPDVPLMRLTTLDEKVVLLAKAGVDGVAVLNFSLEMAGWTPAYFMDEVLVRWLGAKAVCVGENFRFGHKASGDVELLAPQTTFTTHAVPLFKDEAGVVSSSRLRAQKAVV